MPKAPLNRRWLSGAETKTKGIFISGNHLISVRVGAVGLWLEYNLVADFTSHFTDFDERNLKIFDW
jgi:hypothetical protein